MLNKYLLNEQMLKAVINGCLCFLEQAQLPGLLPGFSSNKQRGLGCGPGRQAGRLGLWAEGGSAQSAGQSLT